MFFQCITIPQVPWEVLKTAAFGLRTWRMLMHEKPCLIPLLKLHWKKEHCVNLAMQKQAIPIQVFFFFHFIKCNICIYI